MANRYLCDVLDEMRKCYKTRNFSHLLGLIEEAQTLANRMEAGLGEKRDYQAWHKKAKAEKDEYMRLANETNKLRKDVGEPESKEASRYA